MGKAEAEELRGLLKSSVKDLGVQVLPGNKVIEVKNAGVDKGAAALKRLDRAEFDFILGAGDDRTDEDLFRALPSGAYTVKVGATPTAARFAVHNPEEMRDLLRRLTQADTMPLAQAVGHLGE